MIWWLPESMTSPLDLPDAAVGGMDLITAARSYLSGGKSVIGDGGWVQEQLTDLRERGIAVVCVRVVVLQRNRLAGGAEPFELRDTSHHI